MIPEIPFSIDKVCEKVMARAERFVSFQIETLLKPLLESDAVLKIGQNIKYDINILARNGIALARKLNDAKALRELQSALDELMFE